MTISTPEGSAPLPDSVRRLLVDAVTALDRGQVVTVEPHRTVLTTQEAAELLGTTRPTLVRLLEAGKISYSSPSRHRRVELADVLAFRQHERARRGQVFEEMAHEETPDPGDASDTLPLDPRIEGQGNRWLPVGWFSTRASGFPRP